MEVTYTRSYLQRLCEQAKEGLLKARTAIIKSYDTNYENEILHYRTTRFYERWFMDSPVSVYADDGGTVTRRMKLAKLKEQFEKDLAPFDDLARIVNDILSAIEQSQDTEFKLDYQLAAYIKEAVIL